MLETVKVDRIAGDAALAALTASSFLRVQTESTTDSDGRDAVLVTLVINDLKQAPVSGDEALDTIVRVRHALERAGEDRTVMIEFATESDLAADGSA